MLYSPINNKGIVMRLQIYIRGGTRVRVGGADPDGPRTQNV